MKRSPRTPLALVFLATMGCGDEEGQFVVLNNAVPNAGCVVPAGRSETYRGEGVLDVALVRPGAVEGYLLFPIIENNLRRRQGATTNRLYLRGAEVRVEPVEPPQPVAALFQQLAGNPQTKRLIEYEEPWSGIVEPGGGTTSMIVNAFPAQLARQIRDTKALESVTHMRAFIHLRVLADGSDGATKSDEFHYPLNVCHGCLVASAPPCPAAPASRGDVCNIAQDTPVDCCVSAGQLICPSVEP